MKNDVRKLYLRNHKKTRTSWLNFGEDMKKQEEKVGLLGDFSGNWQPDLLEKIGPKPKIGRYFGKVIFYKVEEDLKPY